MSLYTYYIDMTVPPIRNPVVGSKRFGRLIVGF